jgi:hypothetical protein
MVRAGCAERDLGSSRLKMKREAMFSSNSSNNPISLGLLNVAPDMYKIPKISYLPLI